MILQTESNDTEQIAEKISNTHKKPFYFRMWFIILLVFSGIGFIPAVVLFALRLGRYPEDKTKTLIGAGVVLGILIVEGVAIGELLGIYGNGDQNSEENDFSTIGENTSQQTVDTEINDEPEYYDLPFMESLISRHGYITSRDGFDFKNSDKLDVIKTETSEIWLDKEWGVYAFYVGNDVEIEIPETINGVKIVGIGPGAFSEKNKTIRKIILPNSVKNIGNNAFTGLEALEEIRLPNNIKRIREGTFSNCYNLVKIEIPTSVRMLEDGAFASCQSLTEIAIPEGVTHLPKGAFARCSALSNVTLPESLTEIDDSAFYGSGIQEIRLPDNVERIGKESFCSCNKLTTVTFPSKLSIIDLWAFYSCNSLHSVSLPASITFVGTQAFASSDMQDIYYAGTEEQWMDISFDGMPYDSNPVIHFNDGSMVDGAEIYDKTVRMNDPVEFASIDAFSEGLSWFVTTAGIAGVINEDREVQFYLDGFGGGGEPYDNGVSYIYSLSNEEEPGGGYDLYLVDKSGSIISSFPQKKQNGHDIIAYGGGYQVLADYHSGIEGNSRDLLGIYDYNGNKVNFDFDFNASDYYIEYYNHGVFHLNDVDMMGVGSNYLLFSKSGVVRDLRSELPITLYTNPIEPQNYCAIAYYEDTSKEIMMLLDENGNSFEVLQSFSEESTGECKVLGISTDTVFMQEKLTDGYRYYSVNVATGKISEYSGKYQEYIDDQEAGWRHHNQQQSHVEAADVSNGFLCLPLKGKDGNMYKIFVDSQMQEVGEPILSSLELSFVDGIFCCYDGDKSLNGEESIYTVTKDGINKIRPLQGRGDSYPTLLGGGIIERPYLYSDGRTHYELYDGTDYTIGNLRGEKKVKLQ